jgi:hypothetical protein
MEVFEEREQRFFPILLVKPKSFVRRDFQTFVIERNSNMRIKWSK